VLSVVLSFSEMEKEKKGRECWFLAEYRCFADEDDAAAEC
jgi:hypothetical protein